MSKDLDEVEETLDKAKQQLDELEKDTLQALCNVTKLNDNIKLFINIVALIGLLGAIVLFLRWF